MELNNYTKLIVGAVVGLALFAGLLLPMINSSEDSIGDLYSNTPANGTFATMVDSATFTIHATTDGTEWSYAGIDVSPANHNAYMMADKLHIILSERWGIAIRIVDETAGYEIITTDSWSTTAIDIAITPDSIVVSDPADESHTASTDYSFLIYTDNEGDRAILYGTSAKTAYVHGIEDVVSVAVASAAMAYSNGESCKAYASTQSYDATLTASVTEGEQISEVALGDNAFYLTATFNTNPVNMEPNLVSVPAKIIVRDSTEDTYATLVAVIPLLVIVLIVVFVAAEIRYKH